LQYTFKEPVKLWVNKIGPFNNPQETYNYYYLPFCKPKSGVKMERSWGGLGETLQGNELINSQLLIEFGRE
jgi:transmembrane 9 superfamily protein 3